MPHATARSDRDVDQTVRPPSRCDALAEAARSGLRRAVRAGVEPYDRQRALPRLTGIDPREIACGGPALRPLIVERLTEALRAERRKGRVRHWTYDLNRHIALMQALEAEQASETALSRPAVERSHGPRA